MTQILDVNSLNSLRSVPSGPIATPWRGYNQQNYDNRYDDYQIAPRRSYAYAQPDYERNYILRDQSYPKLRSFLPIKTHLSYGPKEYDELPKYDDRPSYQGYNRLQNYGYSPRPGYGYNRRSRTIDNEPNGNDGLDRIFELVQPSAGYVRA